MTLFSTLGAHVVEQRAWRDRQRPVYISYHYRKGSGSRNTRDRNVYWNPSRSNWTRLTENWFWLFIYYTLCYILYTMLYIILYVVYYTLCYILYTMLCIIHYAIYYTLCYMLCTMLYIIHYVIYYTLCYPTVTDTRLDLLRMWLECLFESVMDHWLMTVYFQ